jgi:S-DNA-T family DNA segregation ATPase FtsK/SpoIIIE
MPGQAGDPPDRREWSLRLWPIVCVTDEAQNLFAYPEHGKAAGLDAEFIIKIGPAFGVVLIIARAGAR